MQVSIIVPVYNVANYLDKCVNSILGQSYVDFELILVNDGSTDGSDYICDQWTLKDKRIKVFHKENGGLSSARNYGIENAVGEYLCFIDSDDYIHKEYLACLVEGIKRTGCKMSMCLLKKDYGDEFLLNHLVKKEYKVSDAQEMLMALYGNQNEQMVVAVNKLYHKSLFRDMRYPIGKIHEDEFLTPNLIRAAGQVAVIYEALYYYFIRKGSITQQGWSNKRLDYIEALEKRIELAEEINDEDFKQATQEKYCRVLAESIYMVKRTGDKRNLAVLKDKFYIALNECYSKKRKFLQIIQLKALTVSKILYRCINKFQRLISKR